MTSKERAKLRAQAHSLQPVFQIGKGGISDALIAQTEDVLNARELIKLKVLLESAPEKPAVLANVIAEKTGADVIGVIGGVIILYRYSEELHAKEAKKAANKKAAAKLAREKAYEKNKKY